jgi:cyclic beta-1,2-glucan synthetase
VVSHGFGHTRFQHTSRGIALELLQFVPLADPIKVARLKIANRGDTVRNLSITHYLEWVLGNQRARTAPFIITELDQETSALLARNPWSVDFPARVAFMDMRGKQLTACGDRAEFLGKHGSLAEPAALLTPDPLSNRAGAGYDPCGALQTSLRLSPGEEGEIVLFLGQEASRGAALELLKRYRAADLDASFKEVAEFWDQTLGAIQVKTPDPSMDVLLNGWLLYQTLACRLWARTAFYQSSGAWGYRDQLQDVMALCVARPTVAREHILRAAARQFRAGDVQHWWLPVTNQGIKTRVSDDRVWLPYVVAHYLEVTEDFALLD